MHILDLLMYFILCGVILNIAEDEPLKELIFLIVFTIIYVLLFVIIDYNWVDIFKYIFTRTEL